MIDMDSILSYERRFEGNISLGIGIRGARFGGIVGLVTRQALNRNRFFLIYLHDTLFTIVSIDLVFCKQTQGGQS
jgi:hypothetical protein